MRFSSPRRKAFVLPRTTRSSASIQPRNPREVKWEEQARAIPDAARVRTFIEKLSASAHLAGTPASKQTAEYLLAQLREFGLDAHIEQFEALLPTPRSRSLELDRARAFHGETGRAAGTRR